MKKQLSYLFLIFLCLGVSSCTNSQGVQQKKITKDAAIDSAQGRVAKVLSKKFDIKTNGFGGGERPTGLWLMSLSFEHKGILSKEEARCLMVKCVEESLKIINSDEEVRPYLENYPFKPGNLGLTVFIHNKQGEKVYFPKYCVVSTYSNIRWSLEKGDPKDITARIFYNTIENESAYTYKTDEFEPYQEAKRIAIKQGCFRPSKD